MMKKLPILASTLCATVLATVCLSGCGQSAETKETATSTEPTSSISSVATDTSSKADESKAENTASKAESTEESSKTESVQSKAENSQEESKAESTEESSETESLAPKSLKEFLGSTENYSEDDVIRYGKVIKSLWAPYVENSEYTVIVEKGQNVRILKITDNSYYILDDNVAALIPKENIELYDEDYEPDFSSERWFGFH